MKKLLLIGGTGFFGKSFLDCYKREMLAKWRIEKILIMSRNVERLRVESPELLSPSIELIKGDVGNIDSLPYADYVIHAAASTDAKSYLSQPDIEKRNIQAATYNYCRLAKLGHFNSKILYISSGAVYGPQPDDLPFLTETYPFYGLKEFQDGRRDYAFAKRDAEYAISELGVENINVAIARCFAFIGPWLPRNQHFAIGNFIEDGLMGRPIRVQATSPVYRSYMHADDLVQWLMTICDNANSRCPIYNVGSDESLEIEEVANLMAKKFNVQVSHKEFRQGKVDRYIPSISKAKKELGLSVSINLNSAIDKTVEQIRSRELYV